MKNSNWIIISCAGVLTITAIFVHGCGSSNSPTAATSAANIPLITPPVKSATPTGFGGSAGASLSHIESIQSHTLSASDIKSRFFSAGPTDLFNILANVDGIISQINSASGACITQTPVSYQITPFGETVTMYAQCARTQTAQFTGDPGIFQFGVKNNLVYVYSANGVERVAAVITPLSNGGIPIAVATEYPTANPSAAPSTTPSPDLSPLPSSYQVEVWLGVGYGNPASTGSYGVVHLIANTVTKTFEMTVAGQGFGYCGAQLKSDGTNIYATGSIDMGTSCNAIDTLCVLASDGTTTGTCGSALTTFSLAPLGRQASTGPNSNSLGVSQYPGGNNNGVILNGSATDSLWFGPLTVTTGVGKI